MPTQISNPKGIEQGSERSLGNCASDVFAPKQDTWQSPIVSPEEMPSANLGQSSPESNDFLSNPSFFLAVASCFKHF